MRFAGDKNICHMPLYLLYYKSLAIISDWKLAMSHGIWLVNDCRKIVCGFEYIA